jgi:hypothetical protein
MALTATTADDTLPPVGSSLARIASFVRRNPTILIGGVLLLALIAMALIAPWFAGDPFRQAPINRLRPPSERFWFGTDQFGRDVFSRTVYGARVSLIVGLAVSGLASRHHARDGRDYGDPLDPARDCAHYLDQTGLGHCDCGNCDPGGAAHRARGALRRSVDPCPALRRERHRWRHTHGQAIAAPHSAQHPGAVDRTGDLRLRLSHAD